MSLELSISMVPVVSAAQTGVFETHKRLYIYPAFSVRKRAMVDLAPAVNPDTGAQLVIYNPPTSYLEEGLLELQNATVSASNVGGRQIATLTGYTGREFIDPSRGGGGETIDLGPLEEHAARIAARVLRQSSVKALLTKGVVVHIGVIVLVRHGHRLGIKLPPFNPLARYCSYYATHPVVYALLTGVRLEHGIVPIVVGKPARRLTEAQVMDLIFKVAGEMGSALSEALGVMQEVAELIVERIATRGERVDIDDLVKAIGLGMEKAFEAATGAPSGGAGREGGGGSGGEEGGGKRSEEVDIEEIAEDAIVNILS